MGVVEESVKSATWIPRMMDFHLPKEEEEVSTPQSEVSVLADRANETNIPLNTKSPIRRHRKTMSESRSRVRKGRSPPQVHREEEIILDLANNQTITYRPRRSKYDV
jgi:hypothetical protein